MLLERDNLQDLQDAPGKTASSPARVTKGGSVVVGHTTPPTSSCQRPKVLNLSVFLTISDGSRRSNELAPSPMAGYEIVSGWTFRGLSGMCVAALLTAARLCRLKGRGHVREHRSVPVDRRCGRDADQAVHDHSNRDGILCDVVVGTRDAGPIVLKKNNGPELPILHSNPELLPTQFPILHFLQFSFSECGNHRGIKRCLQTHVFQRDKTA